MYKFDVPPTKFGHHMFYGNGDINSYVNKKAELTASIRYVKKFSKSGILIYNSEILDTAGRITTLSQ